MILRCEDEMSDDLLTRLQKVEPDAPGERTRWFRNPDGPDAVVEIERLRAERDRLRTALEAMRHECTCHDAYVERGKVDPSCLAAEVGDDARHALGEPGVCRGRSAFHAKLEAELKGE